MALRTLQLSSNLTRPNRYYLSSSSAYCCKVPARLAAKVAAKKLRKRASSPLKCKAVVLQPRQDDDDGPAELPLVPFRSVVFPGATIQLQMFEFRNRMMMHTLLQEGLRFGVVYLAKSGGMADAGCVVRVVEHQWLVDDRFFLTCVAGDRFRVVDVVRTKPYAVAKIEALNDRDNAEQHDELERLADEVEDQMKSVARLSSRLNLRSVGLGGDGAEHTRGSRSPSSFSFAVARLLSDDPAEQQALLRSKDAAQRLERERRCLERRCKYLAAVAAITDALEHLSCNGK